MNVNNNDNFGSLIEGDQGGRGALLQGDQAGGGGHLYRVIKGEGVTYRG